MTISPTLGAKPQDVRALLQGTVFGSLGPEPLERLAPCCVVERYEVPSLLNRAGTPLERFRLVVEGNIALLARHVSGREVVVSEIGPGAWATWIPALTSLPPEHDLYSSSDSVYLAIPTADVRRICERFPALYPLVLAEVGQRMRLLMAWTGQSVLLQPVQRMALLIVLLARDQKMPGNSGSIGVTQQRLASLARCSRQSANTLLGDLQQRGLIQLAYGRCEIPDLAELVEFSQASSEQGG